jgi:hypothetical protein
MEFSLLHRTDALVLCVLLFFAMITMVPLGRMAGRLWKHEGEHEPKGGVNSLQGALFGLSAFILAFTFGMSASRFNNIRDLIAEEGDDMKTAVLRSDLYPDSIRDAFHVDFKKYIEARISYYNTVTDTVRFNQARRDVASAQEVLWAKAMYEFRQPDMMGATNNMLPALNNMFNIATTIEITSYSTVPDLVIYMLFTLALVTSFIGGFTSSTVRRKDWIVVIVFALLSSMVTYITLDLGRPLRGFIKADTGIEAIKNLNNSLK